MGWSSLVVISGIMANGKGRFCRCGRFSRCSWGVSGKTHGVFPKTHGVFFKTHGVIFLKCRFFPETHGVFSETHGVFREISVP